MADTTPVPPEAVSSEWLRRNIEEIVVAAARCPDPLAGADTAIDRLMSLHANHVILDWPEYERLRTAEASLADANARIATLTVERKEDAARQGAEIMRQLALIQQQGSEIVRWQGRAETASASLAEARAALRASAVDLVWLEGRVREVIDEALHDDDPVAYGAAAIMSLHASHVILDATDAVIAALSPPQQAGTEAQS